MTRFLPQAEAYHQKWLLQRKGGWLSALGLLDVSQLVDSPVAARLNVLAAGQIGVHDVLDQLEAWERTGLITTAARYLRSPARMHGI